MLTRPITRGITRPITRPLVRQSSAFDPLTLFSEGQQGAWYDPSDLATLFEESTGTDPVDADSDPAGMALDKHLGLELGPELVVNGTFDDDLSWWEDTSGATYDDGRARLTYTSEAARLYSPSILADGWVKVSFDMEGDVDIYRLLVRNGEGSSYINPNYLPFPQEGRKTGYIKTELGGLGLWFRATSTGSYTLDNISVRELPGNHAVQDTTAAKPTYRTDGTLHWLEFDGDDDQLVATIPGITNATVAIAKSTGTEITYPVDLSGGEFVMDETNYGVIVREGEFTEQEALNVTAYLNAKAGIES